MLNKINTKIMKSKEEIIYELLDKDLITENEAEILLDSQQLNYSYFFDAANMNVTGEL